MPWHRELALFLFLSAVLGACRTGMRTRADASGSTVDLAALAPSEDAPSVSPARDAHPPDEAVLGDSATPDAPIPDAVLGDSAVVDSGRPVEVARIVRRGTNFGTATVVVYSDASAIRTKEESMTIRRGLDDAAGEPSVEILPPGTPEVVKLLEDLNLVDDVSALGGWEGPCTGQSVSYSTRTHVTVGGKTSRNLECGDGATFSDPVLTADCLALAR